jgi:hypothetical protein
MSSKTRTERSHDKTLEQSFPASDPPAHSGITGSEQPDKSVDQRDIHQQPTETQHLTVMQPKRRINVRTSGSRRRVNLPDSGWARREFCISARDGASNQLVSTNGSWHLIKCLFWM